MSSLVYSYDHLGTIVAATPYGGRPLLECDRIASEVQGGQFRHGFYSSAAAAGVMHSKAVGSLMRGSQGGGWIVARTATAAAIGGTASVLGGGKFANGAVTSAFQQLFNSEGENIRRALLGKEKTFDAVFYRKSGKDAPDPTDIDRFAQRHQIPIENVFAIESEGEISSTMEYRAQSGKSFGDVVFFDHGVQGVAKFGFYKMLEPDDPFWTSVKPYISGSIYLFACNMSDQNSWQNYINAVSASSGRKVFGMKGFLTINTDGSVFQTSEYKDSSTAIPGFPLVESR